MRTPAQLRATLQRTAPTLLIVLAAAIVLVGKADQAMFEPLRISLTDAAAPVLDALSRPLAAAAAAIERVRGIAAVYRGKSPPRRGEPQAAAMAAGRAEAFRRKSRRCAAC